MGRLRRGDLVEPPHSAVDCCKEALLFGESGIEYVPLPRTQLGVCVTHQLDDELDDRYEHWRSATEQPGMPHSAAQNSAEHIPSSLVRREHAIREKKRDRARVIRDYA